MARRFSRKRVFRIVLRACLELLPFRVWRLVCDIFLGFCPAGLGLASQHFSNSDSAPPKALSRESEIKMEEPCPFSSVQGRIAELSLDVGGGMLQHVARRQVAHNGWPVLGAALATNVAILE